MKYLVTPGADPTNVSSLTFLISTASSVTRRWPLFISSSAASLLPIPLSPVKSSPSPYTSSNTPCITIQGASCTLSHHITSAENEDVDSADFNIGI